MAKCSSQAVTYFEALQIICLIFAGSLARWKILEDTLPYITAKPLSDTRWECRLESVRALRYQMIEIREVLFAVADESRDPIW
jgi:hypothetical protein